MEAAAEVDEGQVTQTELGASAPTSPGAADDEQGGQDQEYRREFWGAECAHKSLDVQRRDTFKICGHNRSRCRFNLVRCVPWIDSRSIGRWRPELSAGLPSDSAWHFTLRIAVTRELGPTHGSWVPSAPCWASQSLARTPRRLSLNRRRPRSTIPIQSDIGTRSRRVFQIRANPA